MHCVKVKDTVIHSPGNNLHMTKPEDNVPDGSDELTHKVNAADTNDLGILGSTNAKGSVHHFLTTVLHPNSPV